MVKKFTWKVGEQGWSPSSNEYLVICKSGHIWAWLHASSYIT